MVCRSIKPSINKVCVADLNKKIKLQYSSSIPNNNPNMNAGTSFKDIKTVWAMVKTRSAAEFIKNTDINRVITTEFYIRFDSSIDFETELYIELGNQLYKVINVENIDEQDRFVKLSATDKGLKTIEANKR